MTYQGKAGIRTSKTGILALLASTVFFGGCLGGESSPASTNDAADSANQGGSNHAPTISGDPPNAVLAGEAYSFTPSASDPDGDDLTFSIRNKPGWATFDSQTGTLSGMPSMANIGSATAIRISVSDGNVTVSMPEFSIEVMQVGPASTTLSWSAPTENEDGSALTDLAGYKLFYGRSSGDYTNVIRIDNPSITTYVVENLAPATYYFAAKAFNTSGIESAFSGEAVRTVN